jgi:hypothetical protein
MTDHRPLISTLTKFFEENKVCSSHGFDHAMAVYANGSKIRADILANVPDAMTPEENAAASAADMLHDTDDPKIFPPPIGADQHDPAVRHANVRTILSRAADATRSEATDVVDYKVVPRYSGDADDNEGKLLYGKPKFARLVEEMIDLVSCSKNGNTIPESIRAAGGKENWKLSTRYADRLEAVGITGIERCLKMSITFGNPLYDANLEDHLNNRNAFYTGLASCTELFDGTSGHYSGYAKRGGKSTSFIGHFFDKLFDVCDSSPLIVVGKTSGKVYQSKVLEQMFNDGYNVMIDFVRGFIELAKLTKSRKAVPSVPWYKQPITPEDQTILMSYCRCFIDTGKGSK